jgi:chaperonin GroES
MTTANWIRWNSTELAPEERESLLAGLAPAQRHQLLQTDYAWLDRAGVLWRSPEGDLRRTRFTHGASFETTAGEFRIDAEGTVSAVSARSGEPTLASPALAALPPLRDRLLVKRVDPAATAPHTPVAGGLRLTGRVIATGRPRSSGNAPPRSAGVGDRVLFSRYAGEEVQIAGESYFLIREDEVRESVARESS